MLGGHAGEDGREYWWVEDIPDCPFACFTFAPVPEPKAVKNRIHWDVTSADLPALLDRGATVLGPAHGAHAVARVRRPAGQRVLRLRPA